MDLRSLLARVLRPGAADDRPRPSEGRTTGRPPSGNGASSFHLRWEVPPVPLVEAAVTLEVVEPPTVDELYFWALQVSFVDGARRFGAAHTGLQHNRRYPGRCAVNWGGYHEGGGVLDGSASPLACSIDDVNTHTFGWQPHRRYRFRIHRSPDRGWRASVTDLDTGEGAVIRDLWVEGRHLAAPLVWSEVFARCDDPPVAVRWTDLAVVTEDGGTVGVDTVTLNYQRHADGGCANTDTSTDELGFVQRTATTRRHPTGTRLSRR